MKREAPADDVISDLLAASQRNDNLTKGYIATLVAGILFAGHDTTVVRLDYGVAHLLSHPDLAQALRRDPGLAADATEEVLRVAAPARPPTLRWARNDFEIDSVRITAGGLVMLAPPVGKVGAESFTQTAPFQIKPGPNPPPNFRSAHHFFPVATPARRAMAGLF